MSYKPLFDIIFLFFTSCPVTFSSTTCLM